MKAFRISKAFDCFCLSLFLLKQKHLLKQKEHASRSKAFSTEVITLVKQRSLSFPSRKGKTSTLTLSELWLSRLDKCTSFCYNGMYIKKFINAG
jgi:hypothetical protein